MPNPRIVQMDIHARDAIAQQHFYTELFGWTVSPAGDPDEYGWLMDADGAVFGGVGQAGPDADPGISIFVQVDDPNATMESAERLGGGSYFGPLTFPDGMITACLRDPDGYGILLIQPGRDGQPYASRPPVTPDRWSWEIQTPNVERLSTFYSTLFGWKIDALNEWGWAHIDTGSEGGPDGAIARAEMPTVFFYVHLDDLDIHLERAQSLGGRIVVSPWNVAGTTRIAVLTDPEGNRLGLMERSGLPVAS